MKKLRLTFLCASLTAGLYAQSVTINEDPKIAVLMQRFEEINRSQEFTEGWRVQVLATTDRRKVEEARQSFQYRFPNIAVDWVHTSPYYKLRAGAFATKLEAIRLQYILKRDYPGAYPAKDNKIKPQELIY